MQLLYVPDEFTREALAMEAERRIDADKVVDVLDRIVRGRGAILSSCGAVTGRG